MKIDYFCALSSPWSFMGHARLGEIARAADATVVIHPVNAMEIFNRTGGLPLGKRSPERQAYRMQELLRWRKRLNVAVNANPAHFPVDETEAACLVVAARESGLDAFDLTERFMRAVWSEERDISDTATIAAVIAEAGMDHAALAEHARAIDAAAIRNAETERAIGHGVFGAPFYVIGEDRFWGQDRLDFVAERLQQ